MANDQGLLSRGWSMVTHNKRYIIWFYLLNLTLAEFGASAFRNQAHAVLDHSLLSDRLLHGMDAGVLMEMLIRPEFGPTKASAMPALYMMFVFFALSAVFIPGVLQGYASNFRLPREDFFRACGRNFWRFVRLLLIALIVFGIASGILFGIRGALIKAAGKNLNEVLPFYTSMIGLAVIFLVMSALRAWFDIAQADVVLNDQRAVRKSIGTAFRHTMSHLGSLLTAYVFSALIGLGIFAAGIWAWMTFVPPASWLGAFFVSQFTLLLLLIPRFWQRAIAVSYYLKYMVEPIPVQSFAPAPSVASEPVPTVVPVASLGAQNS